MKRKLNCNLLFISQSFVSARIEVHDMFKIFNVSEKDAGKYWCRAFNFVGKSERAFWLKIHKPGKGKPRARAAAILGPWCLVFAPLQRLRLVVGSAAAKMWDFFAPNLALIYLFNFAGESNAQMFFFKIKRSVFYSPH